MGLRLKGEAQGSIAPKVATHMLRGPRAPGGRVMASSPRCLYSCGFLLLALRWVALSIHQVFGVEQKVRGTMAHAAGMDED